MSLVAGNPVVTGTTIAVNWANPTLVDIANEITNSIARDGTSAPTANLPMGGFKWTNVGAPVANDQVLTWGQFATVKTLTVTDSTIPVNGEYLPAANTLGWATNSVQRLLISTSAFQFNVNGSIQGSDANSINFVLNNTIASGHNYAIYSSGGGPAAVGTFGIFDSTRGTTAFSVGPNGNFVIPAPVSGTGLAVNQAGANRPVSFINSGANDAFALFKNSLTATGTDFGVGSDGNTYLYVRDSTILAIGTGNATRLSISATGTVSVAAPSIVAPALGVTGASTAQVLTLISSGAGSFTLDTTCTNTDNQTRFNAPTNFSPTQQFAISFVTKAYVGIGGTTNIFIPGLAVNDFFIRTESTNILFCTNAGGSIQVKIPSTGGLGVTARASGTGLTVSGGSGGTGASIAATGAVYTIDASNTSADAQIRLNAPTGFSPVFNWDTNSVIKGYNGTAGSAGAYVTGSATGDYFIRSENFNILLSANAGTSAQFKLSSAGDITARGVAITKYKAGNTDRASNVTLANDPDLTYAVPAAGTYEIFLFAQIAGVTSGAAGMAMNLNYSGTFTATSSNSFEWSLNAVLQATVFNTIKAAVTTIGQSLGTSLSTGVPSDYIMCRGTLIATGAGTVGFSWAQQSSNVNATRVMTGSFLRVTQLS